ncbi:hypothetical protein ACFCZ1_22080 [Streptomyces sp. NPDC056224]|uniref:hypothetical protein n=1 Tax=Streptomyces sp. NPDC056224 TaxID=3345750 RepID=UPI0035DA34B7
MGLPALFGSLRVIKVPEKWACILAVLLHVAWSVLLLLDRLPWPTPDFNAKYRAASRVRAALAAPAVRSRGSTDNAESSARVDSYRTDDCTRSDQHAVALADLIGRRIGGREAWWWVPLMVAALVAPPIAAFAAYNRVEARPMLVFWAVATAALSVGGLVARPRHPGLVRRVAVWGTAVVAGTGLLGPLGLAVGLLPAYEPPAIGPATMVGAWVDHTSGTLVFTPDGRVTASGVGEHDPDDPPSGPSRRCSGAGPWSYEPGRGVWAQEIRIRVPGCSWPARSVGGTDRKPRIYQHIGHPDSGKRYELRKAADGS